MAYLHRVMHVVSLNLQQNALTHEGIEFLAEGLSRNISVVEVDLSNVPGSLTGHNHAGERGAIYLSAMLEVNRFLVTLNLSGNRICDTGC